jgi:hypothetical protein
LSSHDMAIPFVVEIHRWSQVLTCDLPSVILIPPSAGFSIWLSPVYAEETCSSLPEWDGINGRVK